jgi:pilus assembly protein CpaC
VPVGAGKGKSVMSGGAVIRAKAGRLLAILAVTLLALCPAATQALAEANVIQISSSKSTSLKIAKGKPRTIKTNVPFYEIVIGDPEIANVNPLTDKSFYVLGNKLGTTGIALFDENKQLVGSIDIEVTLDTDKLASTIRDTVPGADIDVKSANGRLVLSGSADDAIAADKATKIASEFSGEEKVINSVRISSSQQVQLNVRFVEINRQVGHELGTQIAAQYIAGNSGVSFNSNPNASDATPAGVLIGSLLSGGFSIDVAIKALEDRGVARRLAEPNLIARSGQTASFLAGGEFPIPVQADNNSITVEYKKFGVSLDFTPTVLQDGLISLDIAPEVSSVDPSSSYKIGTIAIPGFVVRRAHTSVDLKSGQSFMIAGLLQSQNDTTRQQIPGFGNVPVLGALFSSKAYQRHETDLVMIVTPYLVKPMDPTKKPRTPADGTFPASTSDYFLGNVDETKARGSGELAYASPKRSALPAPTSGHFLDLPVE